MIASPGAQGGGGAMGKFRALLGDLERLHAAHDEGHVGGGVVSRKPTHGIGSAVLSYNPARGASRSAGHKVE